MADIVQEAAVPRPLAKRGVTPTRRMLQIASARTDFRIGFIGFGLLVMLAIFLPLISSIDPVKIAYSSKLLPPFPAEGWKWPYLLGTDQLAKQADAQGGFRIDLADHVELPVGAFEVAGQATQFGEKCAPAGVARRRLHLGERRRDGFVQLASFVGFASGHGSLPCCCRDNSSEVIRHRFDLNDDDE